MNRLYAWLLGQPSLPGIIVVTLLALTCVGAYKSFSDSLREHRLEFHGAAAERTAAITGHLARYGLALQSVQALFSASEDVSRRKFHEFVQGLDLPGNLPGIGIIAFVPRVPHEGKETFEQRVREDRSVRPEGYPDYAIRPPGTRAEYFPTDFQEPWDPNTRGHGLDLGGDPVRKASLDLARDTGRMTFTDVLSLAITDGRELGFSIRHAVYAKGAPTNTVEQRRAAFRGVVTAVVRPGELLREPGMQDYLHSVRLRIIDGGRADGKNDPKWSAKVLYDSTGASWAGVEHVFAADLGEVWVKEMFDREIGGRRWYFEYSEKPRALPRHVVEPALIILLGGWVISLLVYRLFGTLTRERRQAVRRVSEMTEDLATSRESLVRSRRLTVELVEALPNPVIFEDASGRYLEVNAAWERMFGIPRAQIRGRLPQELGVQVLAVRRGGLDAAVAPTSLPAGQQEVTMVLPGGNRRDFVVVGAPIGEVAADEACSVNILIDITERRKAELRQSTELQVTATLVNAHDAQSAMARILEIVSHSMGWAWAARWVREEADGGFCCVQGYAADEQLNRSAFATSSRGARYAARAGGMITTALNDRSIVLSEPVCSDMRRGAEAQAAGLHRAVAVPIVVGEQVWEVLEFFGTAKQTFDPWMIESLRGMALQIAMFVTRRQAEAGLAHLATHDPLTQLANRTQFARILEHAIDGARLKGTVLSLMFVDLDRFKFINDTLGHQAGDKVLVEVASRLAGVVRRTDTVARLGGDEFVLLLHGIDAGPDLEIVAGKVARAVAEPVELGGNTFQVTASLGISIFPQHGNDAEALLKRSDMAMYTAKQSGRNGFRIYDAAMDRGDPRRLALEAALRRAIEADELRVHYQPKIAVGTGAIAGAEALLRWESREHGMVSPGEFIPIAEDTGMITEIGAWVMRQACLQVAEWERSGIVVPRISVNLSPLQLAQDVPALVTQVLAKSGLAGERLELEITESAVMHDPEKSVETMTELRAMGVTLAVDDFGTGYSSLGHLKRFPFNTVKIDRSFVMDLPEDKDSRQIARAVVAMARSLHLRTVAEGVETAEQLAFLASQGCDEAQGYLLSRPLAADAFASLVRNWDPAHARLLIRTRRGTEEPSSVVMTGT